MPLPFSLFFVNPSLCRVTVVKDIEGENRMKELGYDNENIKRYS
jgi:hypothetical protein